MKKLNIGDKVYAVRNNNVVAVHEIERTTKTMAVAQNGLRFSIEYSDSGFINKIGGGDRWYRTMFEVETEELKIKVIRQKLISELRNTKFEELSTFQLNAISQIIKK